MGPRPLHIEPDGDDRVGDRQFALPRRHLIQEVPNVLGRHEVLQLDLVVLQRLNELLVRAQQRHLGALVGLVLELHTCVRSINSVDWKNFAFLLNKVSLSHTCPCGVELSKDFLHPHLFNSLIHDSFHILLKVVQVERQQVGQSGILLTEK